MDTFYAVLWLSWHDTICFWKIDAGCIYSVHCLYDSPIVIGLWVSNIIWINSGKEEKIIRGSMLCRKTNIRHSIFSPYILFWIFLFYLCHVIENSNIYLTHQSKPLEISHIFFDRLKKLNKIPEWFISNILAKW